MGANAASVDRWFCGFEMIGISSMGANNLCSCRRMSAMLLGTTTTRLGHSAFADGAGVRPGVTDDEDNELAAVSRKAPGAP